MECKLCRILQKEKDNFLFENGTYAILPTKYMKGHHKRVMIVLKSHQRSIPKPISEMLCRSFVKWCTNYFDEEPTFALVDSTYASLPNHWHRIACDWFGTSAEIKQLHYTPHQAISTKMGWKP